MYTREEFEGRRTAVKRVEKREGRVLAAVSVGLGLAQLVFIRWADTHLVRKSQIPVEGGAFLFYLALVGWLLWRMERKIRTVRPVCPQCGVQLKSMSERLAMATGKCDSCGGQVVEGS
jgi:predicted RNA-binding Zn-ribbon protein involved in translation (DUF1610 family)